MKYNGFQSSMKNIICIPRKNILMICRSLSHLSFVANTTAPPANTHDMSAHYSRFWIPASRISQLNYLFSSPLKANILYCESADIFAAVRGGDSEFVSRWVHSSDLRVTDTDSWTSLHWAVEYGRANFVLLLLDAEPLLLHMKTKEGLSAISIAAWRGDLAMAKLLVDQGSDVTDRTVWGETPLHHAVTFGHVSVCQYLLSVGADPDAMDKMERSPSKLAHQKGSDEMKKLFPLA